MLKVASVHADGNDDGGPFDEIPAMLHFILKNAIQALKRWAFLRVQAALAITELVVVHDSVRDAVSLQVGKVVQLSDETDLDVLNHSMKAMVDRFQNELLPVASQLTARLVSTYIPYSL
ncbi:hypothetical protein DFH29DRAFT_1007452 [Suillus ampliporus]|nr:hypothetical protein DFH29DRAFT_1008963 [Suillus ampliporus]KAG0692332.1 hypothetical protein DFH29DRAFT_1008863 [Suillus ampliporus]KAG0693278.1 hypothetical protein DFH29DRAFT_1007452 [Suillus ampliporus]